MKKIVTSLFIVQLLIISLYGLLAFRGITINNFLFSDKSSIMVRFEYFEEYDFFLNLIDEKDLTVSRYVFFDLESLVIYTSDITLGGKIEFLSGTLPRYNTREFISNIDTSDVSQSGVFRTLYPNTNLAISHIEATENFEINGTYYISTTDLYVLENIVYELSNNINYVELLTTGGNRGGALFIAIDTRLQLYEFAMITLLIFLCILTALAQYSIGQLKSSSILLLHGYSKAKFLKITTLKILKLLITSSLIAYFIFSLYLIYINYSMFLINLSFYFFIFCIALISLYTVLVNAFILLYMSRLSILNILKGKKPYYLIQAFTHCLKLTFIIFLLITTYFSIESFTLLNARLEALSNWEKAENHHRTIVSSEGREISNLALDFEIHTKMVGFYEDMSNYHNAFIIEAYNFFWLEENLERDGGFYSSTLGKFIPPETHANGKNVTISPNYLNVNPIIASNNIPIQEQIIYDDYILNILVPESLRPYQNDILREYLSDFHFQKVRVENIYNSELGMPLNTTPIEDLSIHIIYVEDDQKYFTFNSRIRVEDGNMVTDPIATIYTGNVDTSFLSSNMSSSFFFYTESVDAYSSILPIIIEHDLQSVLRRVESTFDQNGRFIIQLQQQYIRSVSFAIILFIANITITYNLMANYFEKNKYKLFIKSLFGHTILKRNIYFIAILLTYSLVAVTIIGLRLGTHIFFIGLLVLVIDIGIAWIIDRILLNKSFSKIIKGER